MMDTTMIEGIGVALVTPFDFENNIDYIGFKALLESTAKSGVDYYVVLGTTGESATITQSEKKEILRFVVQNNKNDLPIVYGLGGNSTYAVLNEINNTDLTGVDALLSVCPYYNKPSQKGIIEHYKKIADTSSIPIILYNVPGRTSTEMEASTIIELSKYPNIIGIKQASSNMEVTLEVCNKTKKEFLVISGDDLLSLPMYSIGAKGVISVLANSFANQFKNIINLSIQGKYTEASNILGDLLELNELMYKEGNPVGIKKLLQIQGVCNDNVRLPLLKCSKTLENDINRAYKNYINSKKI